MQVVAQNWLVLELTNSPFLLGLDSFLGQIPIFLLSLIGGAVADRQDRRKLLVGSQIIQMSCAFLLASLFALSSVEVWHILCLSFVVGVAQAFGGPAYQALVPTLVEAKDLANAIALNSIQFNLARIIGPMLGGIALTSLGPAWCFSLNGISFIVVIISLLLLPFRPLAARSGATMLTSIKEGLRFIDSQGMTPLIVIAFLMTMLGVPIMVFLPVIVKNVFHLGPGVFTLMLCVFGAGAVAGALAVAAFGHIPNKGYISLLTLTLLGFTMTAFGLSTSLVLSCILLFISSAAFMSATAMMSSLVQLIAPDEIRGRVMSVYNVAFRGGMPFGSLVSGELIANTSVGKVLAMNGIALALLGLYFLLVQRRVARL